LSIRAKNGVVYHLKYLTELENQVKYIQLTNQEQEDRRKFFDKAKAELPKNAGEEKTNLRAYEMLLKEREANPRQHLSLCNSYIDIFVIGWDGGIPFPKSGKASDGIRLFEKYALYRLIQENITELTGLVFDEAKN
jgi:hypothetical protein